ncbi:MAG: Npun_R1517 family heterocyst differentiation transcriptional regulator [Cyanobacteria bacterium]|nr:Npun_R1517 family heterocyst differentiation transcriptional regulator [Cyanobacteriota bacterium]MDW8202100.1 Npun_R1517 family heterocyst differentiation transcriptional regulator [Cyanobacteriota bacterium SKYGB_h_bin112]
MNYDPLDCSQNSLNRLDASNTCQPSQTEISVYECELTLRFRLIEERAAFHDLDEDELLEKLLEAVTCGNDDYMEIGQKQIRVSELSEVQASPKMRRQLIRLRNFMGS